LDKEHDPASGRRFSKSSRILKTKDFRRVYDEGVKYTCRLFAAFCFDTTDPGRSTGGRVGFTVPRAIGKSVQRNRIRRRMREAVRLDLPLLGARWDVVLNPRRAVLNAPFADVRTEVRKLISRCKP
jgi:ribonuclease P protein component